MFGELIDNSYFLLDSPTPNSWWQINSLTNKRKSTSEKRSEIASESEVSDCYQCSNLSGGGDRKKEKKKKKDPPLYCYGVAI